MGQIEFATSFRVRHALSHINLPQIAFTRAHHLHFEDVAWTVPLLGQPLSMRSLFVSSMSNLIIFVTKQIWSMVRDKNKSAVFAVKPSIKWIVDWEQFGNDRS